MSRHVEGSRNRRRPRVPVLVVLLGLLATLVAGDRAEAQVSILVNEALSINDGSLLDGYGEASDWIELHNPGPQAVDLSGWGLSDDAAAPFAWVFPAGSSISTGEHLLLFATGEPSLPGEFHVSFRLSGDGDRVGLTRPDGALVSELVLPALLPDHSIGVAPGGGLAVYSPPSPGAANAAGGAAGIVADAVAAPGRGFYTQPVQVVLSHPDPAVEIRYTTDTTAPTAVTGTVYSGPITISSSTTLRVAAFRNDWITGRPVTHSYLFASDVPAQANMHAVRVDEPAEQAAVVQGVLAHPAISIVTDQGINRDFRVGTAIEWIDPNGGDGFQVDAGIQEVGGTSVNYAKDTWRLAFDSEWGESSLQFPVFADFPSDGLIGPVDEFKRLTLRFGSHDTLFYRPTSHIQRQTWIKGRWGDETMLELGHVNSHGRWVSVFLNGEYWGQYHLRENFDDHFMASYFGGDNSEYLGVNRGVLANGSGNGWDAAVAAAQNWETWRTHIDEVAYVDWMLLNEYQGNYWDLTSHHNWRGAGQSSAGGSPGFQWQGSDQDITMNYPDRTTRFTDGPADSWQYLAAEKHPDFVALVNDRAEVLLRNGGELTPGPAQERWDRLKAQIDVSIHAEIARWGQYGVNTDHSTWTADHAYVRDTVIPARTQFTLDRLVTLGLLSSVQAPDLPPASIPQGTLATVANPNGAGEVWLTIDGSDPRDAGGGVAADAQNITEFVVDRVMTVQARILLNGEWSPLVLVEYVPVVDPNAPVIEPLVDTVTMQGYGVRMQFVAEHPNGLAVTWQASGLPAGVTLDAATGIVSGVPTVPGTQQIVVTASDGALSSATAFWWTIEALAGAPAPPVVLNEYNAVKSDALLADDGADETLGRIVGNGGDWLELLVVDEQVDLRGWQLELWDRESGEFERTETIVFSDHALLGDLAGGTLLTIAESMTESTDYDPYERDYELTARSATGHVSAFVSGAGNFDTNRHGFTVRLLDANGIVRSPWMGETDGLRTFLNVGGEEVFARCDTPGPGDDPIDGVVVDATTSTVGLENDCNGSPQDLTSLRSGFRGDASCDGGTDVIDALLISRYEVQLIGGSPTCADRAPGELALPGADFNRDGASNIVDALLIAQCTVGIQNPFCHPVD